MRVGGGSEKRALLGCSNCNGNGGCSGVSLARVVRDPMFACLTGNEPGHIYGEPAATLPLLGGERVYGFTVSGVIKIEM